MGALLATYLAVSFLIGVNAFPAKKWKGENNLISTLAGDSQDAPIRMMDWAIGKDIPVLNVAPNVNRFSPRSDLSQVILIERDGKLSQDLVRSYWNWNGTDISTFTGGMQEIKLRGSLWGKWKPAVPAYEIACLSSSSILPDGSYEPSSRIVRVGELICANRDFQIRSQLAFSDGRLVFHLGQLSAQYIPLEQRRTDGEKSDASDYPSSNGEPPSISSQRIVGGIAIIAFGWALIGFALYEAYESRKKKGHIAPAIILGIFGGLLMIHGLFLACTGKFWLLSAPSNSVPENVRVIAVVIPELKFRDVEGEIFCADFMERADHAPLHEAPETFDGLSMDRTANILPASVVHDTMRKLAVQVFVTDPLVGAEQTDFRGDAFADEGFEGCRANIRDHASDYVSFALNRARDDGFTHSTSAAVTASALVFVPVLGFSADKGFVNFNHTHKFAEIFVCEASTDAMAHAPSGFVGACPDYAMDLEGADTFLAGEHHVNDAEPCAERIFRVLEDRPGNDREAIGRAGGRALVTLPTPSARSMLGSLYSATAGAGDAIGPSAGDQIRLAGIFVREGLFPLADSHLVYALAGLFHWPDPVSISETEYR